jgi:RNA polymerase sigma-70 factor (ECF subfamily)
MLALLAARSGDLMRAEDALSEAFREALVAWPARGIPSHPEAWLITVARRRQLDQFRKTLRHTPLGDHDPPAGTTAVDDPFPDERLKLLFVCAHPAIDAAMRTPLMLQTVLGIDAATVAGAFLVSPTAMAQRLVRVKSKIRDAGIPFSIPARAEFSERLYAVLEAVYAAWLNQPAEAIRLAKLLNQLVPNEPEALGLEALLHYLRSRRRDPAHEEFVPFDLQDAGQWDQADIEAAEALLFRAAACNEIGPFQLEAAIQSAHVRRVRDREPLWPAILRLYQALLQTAPNIGAHVAYAAALAQSGSPGEALAVLDQLPSERVQQYQAWHVACAYTFNALGRTAEAAECYERAIGLTTDPALRRYLMQQRANLSI